MKNRGIFLFAGVAVLAVAGWLTYWQRIVVPNSAERRCQHTIGTLDNVNITNARQVCELEVEFAGRDSWGQLLANLVDDNAGGAPPDILLKLRREAQSHAYQGVGRIRSIRPGKDGAWCAEIADASWNMPVNRFFPLALMPSGEFRRIYTSADDSPEATQLDARHMAPSGCVDEQGKFLPKAG